MSSTTHTTPGAAERAELARLAGAMRACSPRGRSAMPPDPAALIHDVEQRSAAITRRRRVGVAAVMVLSAVALVVGLTLDGQRAAPPVGSPPPAQPAPGLAAADHSATAPPALVGAPGSRLVDLGVARLLLRPGARARYDAEKRALRLDAGQVVLHVRPDGRGFRVELPRQTVIVRGTLFSVDADSGVVRVWHGRVEHLDGRQDPPRATLLQGSGAYGELPAEDLRQLDFAVPPPRPTAGHKSRRRRPVGARRAQAPSGSTTTAEGAPAPAAAPDAGPLVDAASKAREDRSRAERSLLLVAQRALAAGQARRALSALARHRRRYPEGQLAEEAALMGLRALVALRDYPELSRRARAFLRRFPGSAQAASVTRLAGQAAKRTKKTHDR